MTAAAARPSLPGPIGPELTRHLADVDLARADVTSLLAGLSEVQLNWRPNPERWSIAQNVTHLTVIGRLYLPKFDDSIRVARERGWRRPGPFRYGPIESWAVRSLEPPPRRRLRAPRMFKPQPVQPLADVRDAFLALQIEIEERIRGAHGLDLRRAKVETVFTRFLRLSLGAAFGALLAHQRRHLWQARQVRREAAFPAE
ncbi:MAG TPA: DinB family protein [Gemmatimonadaceae bacterium]|nr:DinB family protein [Gemmatimonadaceae bacterium]